MIPSWTTSKGAGPVLRGHTKMVVRHSEELRKEIPFNDSSLLSLLHFRCCQIVNFYNILISFDKNLAFPQGIA
jgi:hypothetical protein